MSDHECYLCGAKNDPAASFCSRCSGQLLKLGSDPEPQPEVVAEPELPVVEKKKSEKTSRLSQLRRKSTLDDSRLSDALGLGGEAPTPGIPEAQVTAVPKAKTATDIPIIGTMPGSSRGLRKEDPSRRVFVLLGLLVLAVGWLAWTTFGSASAPEPDNLAFEETTTTTLLPTTTTTEAPIREWSQGDVDALFGDTMVIVQLIACVGEEPTTVQTSGINIDTNTTLIDTAPLPSARSARIFTPLGASREAIITTKSNGATVAVSPRRGSDSLRLGGEPVGENRFLLEFDQATNELTIDTVTSGEQLSGNGTQLLVSNQGEAVEARIAGRTFDHEQLADSVDTLVSVEGAEVSPDDPCTWPSGLAFASGATTEAPAEPATEQEATDEESADAQEIAQ